MTDERMDALIRRLDVPSDPDPEFVQSTYAALRQRARAARVRDASWIGRRVRDLRLVVGDLRETLLTLSAASSQPSWRLPAGSTRSNRGFRQAVLKGVLAVTVFGVIAVGAGVVLTRPGEPSVGEPGPTQSQSASPSPSAGPSVAVEPSREAAWTTTGNMITPRVGHKAVLLLDGRVLAVDGPIETIGPSNSAELYDPRTGTWAATGSMLAPRFEYTATVLPDGRVLVAGGTGDSGMLTSAEVYDPSTGTWTATGAMETARYDHTATLLRDGKVLVAGGIVAGDSADDQVPIAELYDPVSGTWTATGAMAADRNRHTATLLADGKVLVSGGFQDGSPDGPFAELYDPSSGNWTAAGNMVTPTPRAGLTATLLPDGNVLVVGGTPDGTDVLASAELYDPQTGAWSATEGTIALRSGHTATLLADGRVLVAGGWGSADPSAEHGHGPMGSAELYDPASGTWSATASMIAVRSDHTATLLPDGRVLVASGNGLEIGIGSVVLASAELYDPGSGS